MEADLKLSKRKQSVKLYKPLLQDVMKTKPLMRSRSDWKNLWFIKVY